MKITKLTFRAVAEILGLLMSAVGAIYISRVVGPEYLGFSATTTALLSLVSRFADGGLTSLASQKLARDDGKLNTLLSMTYPVKFVSSVFLIVITLLVINFLGISPTLKYFINISVLLVVFEALSPIWVFISLGMINIASAIRIGQSVLYFIIIIVFIQEPKDWKHIPYLTLTGSIITFGLATYFMCYFRLYSFDGTAFGKGYIKKVLAFYGEALHFFKADLSVYVYSTSDRLILYYFTNSYTVGIYEAAYKIITPFYSISSVITPTMFRDLAQSFKKNTLFAVLPNYVFCMALLTIPLGFFLGFFSEFLIYKVYGPDFTDSIPCLKILGFVITIGYAAGIIVIPFSAWSMAREYGNSIFCGNVLNIICNFTLIPLIGAIGAATATLAAKIIVLIVGYIYFNKAIKYPILKELSYFISISIVTLLLTILASIIISNNYLLVVIFAGIYIGIIIFTYKQLYIPITVVEASIEG